MPRTTDDDREERTRPTGLGPPHPAERLVSVKVFEHGDLVKHTVTFVHWGCPMQRLVTESGTQERLSW